MHGTVAGLRLDPDLGSQFSDRYIMIAFCEKPPHIQKHIVVPVVLLMGPNSLWGAMTGIRNGTVKDKQF